MLRNFAAEICGKKPGREWPSRFLKRNSVELVMRYTTGMDKERKRADSAFKYTLYFEMLNKKLEQYGIEPRHMYNMDEKGFLIGVLSKIKRIFSRRRYEEGGMRQVIQNGNREWITTTTIVCICADGTAFSSGLMSEQRRA
jgi:hypothetical protein